MAHRPIHCILAVWGETYTDIFLRYSLPSQLSGGNIPELHGRNARYRIFTTTEDMAAMRRSSVFQRLTSLIDVEFVPITISKENKLSLLADCHNRSIRDADQEDASLVFLSPDFILAENCIAYGMRQWASGKDVVYTFTPRLLRESVLTELDGARQGDVISFHAEDLGDIALRHLHPIEKGYFYADSLVSFPIHIYWPVADEGFVAHCAYLHPLFIRPVKRRTLPAITIDADYVDRCCPDQSRIHVAQDSASMLCVELSSEALPDINSLERGGGFPATPGHYARWANVNANPASDSVQHHWLLQHAIRFHGRAVTETSWNAVERASNRFMRAVRLRTMARRHGPGRFWRMPSFWCNTGTPYTPPPELLRTERALENYLDGAGFRLLTRLGYTRRRHKKVKRFIRYCWMGWVRSLRHVKFIDPIIDAIKEVRLLGMEASPYRAEMFFLHAQSLFFRKKYSRALEWHAKALPGIRTLKYKRIITVSIAELDALPADLRETMSSRFWRPIYEKSPHALGPSVLFARALLREGRADEARAIWESAKNRDQTGRTKQWLAAQKAYLDV